MPEIRRKGPSSVPRSNSTQLAGFRGSAQAEGEAYSRLGQVISNNVAGLLSDVKQVSDRIQQQELSNEMQKRLSDSMKDLSILKPEDAQDGSDIEQRAAQSFADIQADVVGKASSGNVRDNLILQSQDMGLSFQNQAFNLGNKRFLNHTENKLKDFSSQSGLSVLNSPKEVRGDIMLGEISKYNSLLDDIAPRIGSDVAEKFKRANAEEMQKTFVESAEIDESSVPQVMKAIKGESSNEELNKFFSTMEPDVRARSMNKLSSIMERQSRELEYKVNQNIQLMSAMNQLGEEIDPALTQKLIGDVKSSGMKPEDKQQLLGKLTVQSKVNQFSIEKVGMTPVKMAESIDQSLKSFEGSSIDKLEYRNSLLQMAQAKYL